MTNSGSQSGKNGQAEELSEHPLSLDALLEILSNEERRYLVEYLIESSDEIHSYEDTLNYIARQVAIRRGEQPNTEDIEVALHHHHLPKLANAGVIEYDMRTETIQYQTTDRLEEAYDRVRDLDHR